MILTDSQKKQKLWIEFALSDSSTYVKVAGILKPEYFEAPLNRIVEFINTYFTEYRALPSDMIIYAETGVMLDIYELDDSKIGYTLDKIEWHCRNAAMRLAIGGAIDIVGDDGIEDYSEIIASCQKALSVSIDKDIGINQLEDPTIRLERMQQNLDTRSIGWANLDELIDNIRRGELCLFAAGTGVGKSVTLANVANNLAADSLNVLYVSLELSEELVSKRIDSIISGIAMKDIFNSVDDLTDFYNNIDSNFGSIYCKKLPVGTTSVQLRNYILDYKLQLGFYPDVVCLDYIDLMSPNERMRNSGGIFDIDKKVSEELREIFSEFMIYGFTASQFNRDAIDTEVKSQKHIAGGISKINTSDVTVGITLSTENEEVGEMILQALKLRNAVMTTNSIKLYRDPKNLRMEETPTKVKDIVTNGTQQGLNNIIDKMKS